MTEAIVPQGLVDGQVAGDVNDSLQIDAPLEVSITSAGAEALATETGGSSTYRRKRRRRKRKRPTISSQVYFCLAACALWAKNG